MTSNFDANSYIMYQFMDKVFDIQSGSLSS